MTTTAFIYYKILGLGFWVPFVGVTCLGLRICGYHCIIGHVGIYGTVIYPDRYSEQVLVDAANDDFVEP